MRALDLLEILLIEASVFFLIFLTCSKKSWTFCSLGDLILFSASEEVEGGVLPSAFGVSPLTHPVNHFVVLFLSGDSNNNFLYTSFEIRV